MATPQQPAPIWSGIVAISTGIGVFMGTSGDNTPHKHWAHQIAIGIDSRIVLRSNNAIYESNGLWIPAGILHQLNTASVLCIYIDPTHGLCKSLLPEISREQIITPLDEGLRTKLQSHFSNAEDLQSALTSFNQEYHCNPVLNAEDRLGIVLCALKSGISRGHDISRTALADLIHLSPSRFSHWFTEQTGLPLRSYRKWLKLLVGFELSSKMPLADAAISAGFSDQAHFCRAATEAFGVNPTTLRRLLSH